jgi:hypothetical protein
VTSLPTWAVFVISIGTPVMSFVGVVVATGFGRKGAAELEARSRREELLRMVRWAAEMAVSAEPLRSKVGVRQLIAIAHHTHDSDQQHVIDAALDAVVGEPGDIIIKSEYDQGDSP